MEQDPTWLALARARLEAEADGASPAGRELFGPRRSRARG
jgi:hypothetical protein